MLPETVRAIVRDIPTHIEKVGVFVGNFPKNFLELVHGLGLTGSQLHVGLHVASANETKAYGVGCFPPGFKNYTSMPAEWFMESEASANNFISGVARSAELIRSSPGGEQLLDFCPNNFSRFRHSPAAWWHRRSVRLAKSCADCGTHETSHESCGSGWAEPGKCYSRHRYTTAVGSGCFLWRRGTTGQERSRKS